MSSFSVFYASLPLHPQISILNKLPVFVLHVSKFFPTSTERSLGLLGAVQAECVCVLALLHLQYTTCFVQTWLLRVEKSLEK